MCDRPSIDGFTHLHCIRPLGLDGPVSYFYYRGMGKRLIKEVKYRYSTDIVSVIRPYIEKSSPHLFSSISSEQTCVVPIPLHRTKYLYRGFNQSELFGVIISKHIHCSVDNTLLVKTKETLPQAFITEKTTKDNCHCEFFLEKTGEFQVEEEEKFSFANKSKFPNKEIGQKAKAVPFSYNIDKIVSKSNSSIIYQV